MFSPLRCFLSPPQTTPAWQGIMGEPCWSFRGSTRMRWRAVVLQRAGQRQGCNITIANIFLAAVSTFVQPHSHILVFPTPAHDNHWMCSARTGHRLVRTRQDSTRLLIFCSAACLRPRPFHARLGPQHARRLSIGRLVEERSDMLRSNCCARDCFD